MKNKAVSIAAFSLLLLSALGCSFYNPLAGSSNSAANDNRNLSEKAVDATVGEDAIGVPECDELLDSISESSKNQTDDYVSKATREFFLNRIRESVKKSIEENKSDKAAMAKNCRDYKKQLDKFKAEEDGKMGK